MIRHYCDRCGTEAEPASMYRIWLLHHTREDQDDPETDVMQDVCKVCYETIRRIAEET